MSGAVIMKMTSSTSITSMYGTTLIWLIDLRGRIMACRSPLPLQDVGELLDERLEAGREAVHVVGVAVVRDDRGDRGEEPDRRGDQRFRDARRDLSERGLAHVLQTAEGSHDAPYGAEWAHVPRHRAHGCETGEIRFERVDLALVRSAHGAPRAVHRRPHRRALAPVLGVFPEAGGEHSLERAAAILSRALEQLVQVAAFPEVVLEAIRIAHEIGRASCRESGEKWVM